LAGDGKSICLLGLRNPSRDRGTREKSTREMRVQKKEKGEGWETVSIVKKASIFSDFFLYPVWEGELSGGGGRGGAKEGTRMCSGSSHPSEPGGSPCRGRGEWGQ